MGTSYKKLLFFNTCWSVLQRLCLIGVAIAWLSGSGASAQCLTAPCSIAIPTTSLTGPILRSNLGSTSMRLETRLHGQDWAATSNVISLVNLGGLDVTYLGNSVPGTLWYGTPDPREDTCRFVHVDGATDILVRVSRDLLQKEVRIEVNDTATGKSYGTCASRITGEASSAAIKNSGVALGAANATGNMGFVRWYSSVVPVGTPIPIVGDPGDLGNWEFETSLADTSGSGQNFSGSAVSYVNTPTYAPACQAGTTQVLKVNDPLVLDGSASYSADGVTRNLQYDWTVVSSPTAIGLVGGTTATPTVTGATAFGTYEFELTVTQSGNEMSTCRVKHGVVIADGNGVVDLTAEGLSSDAQKLMGPMLMWGAKTNPWPWADDRHKAVLDRQIEVLASDYIPFWRNPLPGTIEIDAGSATVTGVGTDLTEPCNGGTQPLNAAYLIVIYPGTDSRTHYTAVPVVSCTDATHIVLNWQNGVGDYTNSPLPPFPDCTTPCTGIEWQWGTTDTGYGDHSLFGTWIYNAAPGNYYDNVKAFYALYYRTGIDDYLTAAQSLADVWWEHPNMDQGYGCYTFTQNNSVCWPYRSLSLTGIVLRALEEGPMSPKWDGLHVLWERSRYLLSALRFSTGGSIDNRESGYYLAFASYCAMTDPDMGERDSCKAAIQTSLSQVWMPFKRPDMGGVWGAFNGLGGAGTSASGFGGAGSVCVTSGSTTVTGTGTSWQSGFNGSFWTYDAPASQLPSSNAIGDPSYYQAVVNGPGSLTLDRPYEGPTQCNRGFVFGFNYLVGWGVQPWTMGHLGQAFAFAAAAMEGYDASAKLLFEQYLDDVVQLVVQSGINTELGGLYNAILLPGCTQFPIPSTDVACFPKGAAATQTRTLALEMMRAMTMDYQVTGDLAVHHAADRLMSYLFSKPDTGGPMADGKYLSDYDDGGAFITGKPPLGTAPKWVGQLCGYTEGCSIWPAVRDPSISLNNPRTRGRELNRGQVTLPTN